MKEFIQVFGKFTVGEVTLWLAAIVFLAGVFVVVRNYFHKKWEAEKEREDKTKKALEQIENYPEWRRQSIDKQDMFTQAIEKLDEKMDNFIDNITEQLADIRKRNSEGMAYTWRYRILRFDDEIRHEKRHTKEHFDQILEDIRKYELYCKENPDFPNNKAVFAIKNIKYVYEHCTLENSFL